MTRDEYVNRLKQQLDQWNAEAAKWEDKLEQTRAGMSQEYEKQIASLHGRRDEVLHQMRLVQTASLDAWQDLMRGADQAWRNMQEAFEQARSHFENK
ncbi:MAG: hypothetical protein IT514_12720 [Burkholderiales bacterium]|nr:hypothetical protein [Burkholderiales bacterium]